MFCMQYKHVFFQHRRFRKRQEIENKERDQYKEAVCTLNQELKATLAKLKKETHLQEEAEKVKTNLTTELTGLREQMDKAKADAVAEFCVSQPFFDACGIYYGDGFDDCLKQVGAVYPDLDLSQITIDDTILLTLRGDDTLCDKTDDFVHIIGQEVKDTDTEVVIQPTLEGLEALVVSSAVGPTTMDGSSTVDLTVSNVPPS